MKVPAVHYGKYLVCRTLTAGFSAVGTQTLIEDLHGDVEELSLYNFHLDLGNHLWLAPGTVMIVKVRTERLKPS